MYSGRYRIPLTLMLGLCLLAGALLYVVHEVSEEYEQRLQEELQLFRDEIKRSVGDWAETKRTHLRLWAQNPDLIERVALLPALGHYQLGPSLDQALILAEQLSDLRNAVDHLQFAVMDLQGVNLVASDLSQIGQVNPSSLRAGVLDKLRAGQSAYHFSQRIDTGLPYDANPSGGVLHLLIPIMRNNDVLAILVQAIDMAPELERLFRMNLHWRNSLVYAFDHRGVVLTRQPRAQNSHGELLASEPVLAFLTRNETDISDDVRTDGFSGLMGAEVVGAWGWQDPLALGVAVEVDRTEAFSQLNQFRWGVLVAGIIVMTLLAALVGLYVRSRMALGAAQSLLNSFTQRGTSLVIITNARGRIVRTSVNAARVFGRDSLQGKRYGDILPTELATLWHEQDKQVRERQQPATTDEALVVAGNKRWFRIERSPWCDERGQTLGVISVGWDISDFRKSERALQEFQHGIDDVVRRKTLEVERRREQLQNILDTCTDALVSINVHGVILHCNRAMERLFGYGQDELLGQNITVLMDDAIGLQHAQYLTKFSSAAASQTLVGRWRRVVGKTRNMNRIPVEISVGSFRSGDECFFVGVVRDLSERQRQEHLKEILFEQAQDGSLILQQNRVVDCNITAVHMLGLDAKSELIGKSLLDVSTALQPDGTRSADKYARLLRFAEDKGSSRFDWRIRKQDGTPLLVEVNVSTVEVDGSRQALMVLHDIGDRIATQNAIRRSEQRVRDIMNSTQQLMCLLAPDGSLLEANRAAFSLVGAAADTVVGRKLWDTPWWQHAREVRSQLREHVINAVNGQQVVFSSPLQDTSGQVLCIDFAMTPIMQDDRVELIVLEGHDVTAINDARQSERRAREEAEAANQAKGEFLARMSHEIRTPLNAIIGMTRLSLNTTLNDRQRQYLVSVDTAANSLLGIVNDILDFSKIEAGKLELELIPFSLRDVFTHVGAIVGLKAQEKELEFVINDIDIPPRLVGDPLRLQQVLINLCSNAVKFTERGYVELEVTRVMATQRQVRLRFEVRDTGIGMSAEDQSKLFESFAQVDASISRKYGGTGLGLSICRQLVNAMGGDIQVQSVPGQGSTFSFELPFQVDERLVSTPIYRRKSAVQQQILVVDDNPVCWKIEERILLNAGYRVKVAESGQAAIDWMREQGASIDLIVLDWDLPDMNGEDVMRAIADMQGRHMPPVLLVTAYGQDDILGETEYAPQGFLPKPVQSSELRDMVERILSQLPVTEGHSLSHERHPLNPNAATPRILLVEDNEINRFLVLENLQALNVQLDVAENGQTALEIIAANSYDLVLMDLQMPVMDGFECCEHIRCEHNAVQLPVIAMTANAFTRERQRAQAVGMNAFVTKPFETFELIRTIADHLPRALDEWKQWALGHVSSRQQSTHTWQDLPGVHLESALARLHHNYTRYLALTEEYIDHYGQVGTALLLLLEQKHWQSLAELAHKLKGVAGNLGFEGLHRLGSEAEQAGLRADEVGLVALVAAIQRENAQVVDSIEHLLRTSPRPQEAPDTEAWTAAEQASWLEGIRQQLTGSDVVDDRDIARLRHVLAPHARDADVDQLCRSIENFEAQRALQLFDQIVPSSRESPSTDIA